MAKQINYSKLIVNNKYISNKNDIGLSIFILMDGHCVLHQSILAGIIVGVKKTADKRVKKIKLLNKELEDRISDLECRIRNQEKGTPKTHISSPFDIIHQ